MAEKKPSKLGRFASAFAPSHGYGGTNTLSQQHIRDAKVKEDQKDVLAALKKRGINHSIVDYNYFCDDNINGWKQFYRNFKITAVTWAGGAPIAAMMLQSFVMVIVWGVILVLLYVFLSFRQKGTGKIIITPSAVFAMPSDHQVSAFSRTGLFPPRLERYAMAQLTRYQIIFDGPPPEYFILPGSFHHQQAEQLMRELAAAFARVPPEPEQQAAPSPANAPPEHRQDAPPAPPAAPPLPGKRPGRL